MSGRDETLKELHKRGIFTVHGIPVEDFLVGPHQSISAAQKKNRQKELERIQKIIEKQGWL